MRGNGSTNTSIRWAPAVWYATHFPSGENTASCAPTSPKRLTLPSPRSSTHSVDRAACRFCSSLPLDSRRKIANRNLADVPVDKCDEPAVRRHHRPVPRRVPYRPRHRVLLALTARQRSQSGERECGKSSVHGAQYYTGPNGWMTNAPRAARALWMQARGNRPSPDCGGEGQADRSSERTSCRSRQVT